MNESKAADALRRIVQIMGPKALPCCDGCAAEWAEALRIAALAGFSYEHRKARPPDPGESKA